MSKIQSQTSLKKPQQRKPSIDLSTMVYGKIPPQAKDLEGAVLGAIMIGKSALDAVSEILTADSFYTDANQKIFTACQRLSHKNMPVDILTVVEELKIMEVLDSVGGPYAVIELTKGVVSIANIEAHSRIVQQKFIQRELIRIGGEMIGDAYEDSIDVFDMLDDAEKKLGNIVSQNVKHNYQTLEKPVFKVIDKMLEMRARKDNSGIIGVPTGLPKMDQITGGWRDTDLIILAARPSVGKSAVAANVAFNAATHANYSKPVGVFTLEMSADQWAARFLSAESRINSWKISRGSVTDDELTIISNVAHNTISNLKIYVDDTPNIDVLELKSKARKMVSKEKVGLIIIDYLQLMNGMKNKFESREQEISTISRNLKGLAKELQVPVIALSQLSRGVEKNNREPVLSDLRESGAIEQDADVVIFLIAPDEEDVRRDPELQDSLLFKISKHRSGPLDKIRVRFVKEIQKIFSEDEYQQHRAFTQAGVQPRRMFAVPNSEKKDDDLPF